MEQAECDFGIGQPRAVMQEILKALPGNAQISSEPRLGTVGGQFVFQLRGADIPQRARMSRVARATRFGPRWLEGLCRAVGGDLGGLENQFAEEQPWLQCRGRGGFEQWVSIHGVTQ